MSDGHAGSAPARPPRPARPRALLCPNCGAPVTLRTGGSTVTAVCPACTTVLDVGEGTDDPLRIVAAAAERTRDPAIPIGTRGTLDGTEWQVTGFQLRSVQDGTWSWDEYLLFNPYAGFRFLLHDHGAWSLFELLRRDFAAGPPPGFHPGEPATARTDYVLGEFYWRVRVGDQVQVREYQNPPHTLSEERNGSEVTWSQGRALDAAAVRTAFSLPGLPGKAAPRRHSPKRRWVAAVACLLLLVLSATPFGQNRNQVLLQGDFVARDNSETTVAELTVPGRGGSLRIEASSGFDGGAAALHLRLLPGSGQPGYTATMTLGGPFGPTREPQEVTFASVPGGPYRLVADVDTPAFGSVPPATVPVAVTLRRHPPEAAATVLALVCILFGLFAAWLGGLLRRLWEG